MRWEHKLEWKLWQANAILFSHLVLLCVFVLVSCFPAISATGGPPFCVPCLFYLVKERFILSKRWSLLVLYIIVFHPLWMLICTIKPFLTIFLHVVANNTRTALLTEILMLFFEFFRQFASGCCFLKVLIILRQCTKQAQVWFGVRFPPEHCLKNVTKWTMFQTIVCWHPYVM